MNTFTPHKLVNMDWELISEDKPGIYIQRRETAESQLETSSPKLKVMDRVFSDFLKNDVKNTQGVL